jgi:hypothetical protein
MTVSGAPADWGYRIPDDPAAPRQPYQGLCPTQTGIMKVFGWVKDATGNKNYCSASLYVGGGTEPSAACPQPPPPDECLIHDDGGRTLSCYFVAGQIVDSAGPPAVCHPYYVRCDDRNIAGLRSNTHPFSSRNAATPWCLTRGSRGCFAAGTRLVGADGRRLVAVESVRAGDRLWNPRARRAQRVERVVAGPELASLVELATSSRRLRVTADHPMLTSSGVRRADRVAVGDRLVEADGESTRVTAVGRLPKSYETIVYNVELAADGDPATAHWVVADGLVTGDYARQLELGASRVAGVVNAGEVEP